MRHESHRHDGPKRMDEGFKESEEGIAKILLFCIQGKESRGKPSPKLQKNPRIDLNPEGDSVIKKF